MKVNFCSKVIEIEFNKPLFMIEENHKGLKISTKYWICKKIYE